MVRVRFAPSPTGDLHIGGARTALFNWLFARHEGGVFILRIEDTDAARNTPQARAAIFEGLQWLGLHWDEGPMPDGTERGGRGPYSQAKRIDIHQRYIETLLRSGHAYQDPKDGGIRFRLPKNEDGVVPDLVCGSVKVDLSKQPDITIRRADGKPTFHVVNVIDDIEMGITHVIRGEDHLTNTAKHIAIFQALGAEPPKYAHIPLILNPDGSKMSKSQDGAKVADYIAKGYQPEAVKNYLCLLGWSPKDNREIMPIGDVVDIFELSQINRANARFDINKLFWINGVYYSKLPLDQLEEIAKPVLERAGVLPPDVDRDYFRAALSIVHEKTKLAGELPEWMSFFFTEDFPVDPKAKEKYLDAQGIMLLRHLRQALAEAKNFQAAELDALYQKNAEILGIKSGALVHPTRVAVSGRTVGPSLYHTLEVLGRSRVLQRIDRSLAQSAA
jgi:glutamyl-tRNA synthetase